MRLSIRQDPRLPGAEQMRMDRELLEAAAAGGGEILIRFYEWDVPTISLGYHQSDESLDMAALERARVPWVRRPTGGAAVLHSEELTYAVIVPEADFAGSTTQLQRAVAIAIRDGLQEIGVNAQVDAKGEPLSNLSNRVSCFVRTSRWEVTASGKKIVGSAQRKLESGLLQHGSILLGDDHLRISEFLRVSDEAARKRLRESLIAKATSARVELGRDVEIPKVRRAMESSFAQEFSNWQSHATAGIEHS